MKLVHPNIETHIDFSKNKIYSLIVENSKEFYNLTHQLYKQVNVGEDVGQWVLSNNKILNIAKTTLFIYDYYNIDFNSKKIQTLITNEVESVANANDLHFNISQINTLISQINEVIFENIDIPLTSDFEFCLADLIKLSAYKINKENDFLNSIHTYVDIFQKLKNIELVVFVNLFSVLEQEEIENLLKQLKYMNINVLMIDGFDKYNLKNVEKIIIDNDLCVI